MQNEQLKFIKKDPSVTNALGNTTEYNMIINNYMQKLSMIKSYNKKTPKV